MRLSDVTEALTWVDRHGLPPNSHWRTLRDAARDWLRIQEARVMAEAIRDNEASTTLNEMARLIADEVARRQHKRSVGSVEP